MATDKYGTVVKAFSPLRQTASGRLDLRVLDGRAWMQLDIREYVEGVAFSGFTRRGVRLNLEEFQALLTCSDEILQLLREAGDGEAAGVESGGPGGTR